MKRYSDCLQQRCFCKRQIVRQAINDARRNHYVFGKRTSATIIGAGHSENLAVITQVNFAAKTESARAAIDSRIKSYSVVFRKLRDAGPNAGDCPGRLVSHDDRRYTPSRGAIVAVNITATDPASCNPDQKLPRRRCRRGNVRYLQMPVL